MIASPAGALPGAPENRSLVIERKLAILVVLAAHTGAWAADNRPSHTYTRKQGAAPVSEAPK